MIKNKKYFEKIKQVPWIFIIFIIIIFFGGMFLNKATLNGIKKNISVPKIVIIDGHTLSKEIILKSTIGKAPINMLVCFKVNEDVTSAVMTSPDGVISSVAIKTDTKKEWEEKEKGYAYFIFNEVGRWEVECYNNDTVVNKLEIEVYSWKKEVKKNNYQV
jgi:hypothetical protein